MVVNMTHNESVKNFDDIVCHLELEVERLVVARPNEQAYLAESTSRKTCLLDGSLHQHCTCNKMMDPFSTFLTSKPKHSLHHHLSSELYD